jgi:hypothetical protein
MNKKVASELVKAGFRTLAKKYHPDMGGTHNAMLVLKETYENLEKCIENGNWSAPKQEQTGGRRQEGFHQEGRDKAHWSNDFRDKAKGEGAKGANTGPVLEKYKPGYFLIKNVHCVGDTPKALQVMFPGNPVPAWLPRSQVLVQDSDIVKEGDRGNLVITDWIASQKGWRVR